MKAEWNARGNGQFGLIARVAPGRDQTPPFDGLWFDREPRVQDQAALALASLLIFGEYAESTMHFPGSLPEDAMTYAVSLYSRRGIRLFGKVAPREAVKPPPCVLHVVASGEPIAPPDRGPGHSDLILVAGSDYSGSLRSHSILLIGSSAGHLDLREGSAVGSVASGILFAEEMGCRTISVPGGFDEKVMEWARIASLCGYSVRDEWK